MKYCQLFVLPARAGAAVGERRAASIMSTNQMEINTYMKFNASPTIPVCQLVTSFGRQQMRDAPVDNTQLLPLLPPTAPKYGETTAVAVVVKSSQKMQPNTNKRIAK